MVTTNGQEEPQITTGEHVTLVEADVALEGWRANLVEDPLDSIPYAYRVDCSMVPSQRDYDSSTGNYPQCEEHPVKGYYVIISTGNPEE